MTTYEPAEMEALVLSVVDHASAPEGSAKWQQTKDVIRPLLHKGDQGDGWVFVSSLCLTMIMNLGLFDLKCPCGDPAHKPQVGFGFIAFEDGKPVEMYYPDEAPQELLDAHPESLVLTEMVNAEIAQDDEKSHELWLDAVRRGLTIPLIVTAAKQAGLIKRMVIAQAGSN